MPAAPINQASYDTLTEFIEKHGQDRGSLITVLHFAQELIGYLPEEVQLFIARALKLPAAKVYGVVSFYSFFTSTQKGRNKINVCMGTACFVRGADKVLAEFVHHIGIPSGGITEDMEFSLDSLRCVGACGLAPVVMVGDKVFGRVKIEEIPKIIAECTKEVTPLG